MPAGATTEFFSARINKNYCKNREVLDLRLANVTQFAVRSFWLIREKCIKSKNLRIRRSKLENLFR